MLGEKHSLNSDFPEFKDTITRLCKADDKFAEQTKRYNKLDEEIRGLELNNAPIDDEAMNLLKHDRSVLKDVLYQQLVLENK